MAGRYCGENGDTRGNLRLTDCRPVLVLALACHP